MINIFMVMHFIIALLLVCIVLLQKSDQGALGGLGGSGGGLISARGAANLLTKGTSILIALFFFTSLVLALLFRNSVQSNSFMDQNSTAVAAELDDVDHSAPLNDAEQGLPLDESNTQD